MVSLFGDVVRVVGLERVVEGFSSGVDNIGSDRNRDSNDYVNE